MLWIRKNIQNKMVAISSIDAERMKHINHLMDGLHNRLDTLYEELADKEIAKAKSKHQHYAIRWQSTKPNLTQSYNA